jgi:hypothetical protein
MTSNLSERFNCTAAPEAYLHGRQRVAYFFVAMERNDAKVDSCFVCSVEMTASNIAGEGACGPQFIFNTRLKRRVFAFWGCDPLPMPSA